CARAVGTAYLLYFDYW
nr:immunoglobulin heavy chain junction region [Macaca mulatta]MOW84796.1 immunoglobulin heavy chain junction region [Macaca mulatta]